MVDYSSTDLVSLHFTSLQGSDCILFILSLQTPPFTSGAAKPVYNLEMVVTLVFPIILLALLYR